MTEDPPSAKPPQPPEQEISPACEPHPSGSHPAVQQSVKLPQASLRKLPPRLVHAQASWRAKAQWFRRSAYVGSALIVFLVIGVVLRPRNPRSESTIPSAVMQLAVSGSEFAGTPLFHVVCTAGAPFSVQKVPARHFTCSTFLARLSPAFAADYFEQLAIIPRPSASHPTLLSTCVNPDFANVPDPLNASLCQPR
jgi:hypothetical protein